jgi:flavin reductase (DIM6/NTAB) family NADH-FMN oxidoreductase RutF
VNRAIQFAQPDELVMRRTMGRFLTGVAVVTTKAGDGSLHGMTINSLTSISLKPPILMISLNFGTRTGDALLETGRFGISIDGGEFDQTDNGLPVVRGALSQADCQVVHQYDIGDHQVFFGQVSTCRDREGEGLAFNAGKFGSFKDFGHQELPWMF